MNRKPPPHGRTRAHASFRWNDPRKTKQKEVDVELCEQAPGRRNQNKNVNHREGWRHMIKDVKHRVLLAGSGIAIPSVALVRRKEH